MQKDQQMLLTRSRCWLLGPQHDVLTNQHDTKRPHGGRISITARTRVAHHAPYDGRFRAQGRSVAEVRRPPPHADLAAGGPRGPRCGMGIAADLDYSFPHRTSFSA